MEKNDDGGDGVEQNDDGKDGVGVDIHDGGDGVHSL